MNEQIKGIPLRSALFRWVISSILILIMFNVLIAVFQTVITGIRLGFRSEEMSTPFIALMFRLVGIIIIVTKYILATVLLWGILYHFMKSINKSWRNMALSITIINLLVVIIFISISGNPIDKALVFDTGVFIYLSLLLPRLVLTKLKPGNIQ